MIQAEAQILLSLADHEGNLEMYLSKPFEYEDATVPDYKRYARKALQECCIQALEDHNVHPTRYPAGCANLLGIVERQLDVEATIFISGTTNRNCLKILTLDDIAPDAICIDAAMDIFEEWVEKLREKLRNGLENGKLPLGEEFYMPDELSYYTSFEMGLTEEQKKIYEIRPTVGAPDEYEVPICFYPTCL